MPATLSTFVPLEVSVPHTLLAKKLPFDTRYHMKESCAIGGMFASMEAWLQLTTRSVKFYTRVILRKILALESNNMLGGRNPLLIISSCKSCAQSLGPEDNEGLESGVGLPCCRAVWKVI